MTDPANTDPANRLRKLRDDMAVKSRHLMEIHSRLDHNAKISPEAANEAAIAAGVRQPPAPPPPVTHELRLARLEAAERHGLTLDQADGMTSTTPDEIEAEALALVEPVPPGDGGARTPVAAPDPLAEAEKSGDWRTSMSLKNQKLLDLAANNRNAR